MRLLNVTSLELESFYSLEVPKYAILSHTWGDEEVTFQDLTTDEKRRKRGWGKIIGAAAQAKECSCQYIWIDTCCIDKSSSSELTEAINSMFRWYRDSEVCFAYLDDALMYHKRQEVKHSLPSTSSSPHLLCAEFGDLYSCKWFKRGWTLQELIAPSNLLFYDTVWTFLGEKRLNAGSIAKMTGIDSDVLCDHNCRYDKSVARKMSWASCRRTTRQEDLAYCLMGIFDVNLPVLYGEGEKAFTRLQEEIMRTAYDQSLFAWNLPPFNRNEIHSRGPLSRKRCIGVGLLAPCPGAFRYSRDIVPHLSKAEPYVMTNRGIQMKISVIQSVQLGKRPQEHALLRCGYRNSVGAAIAIPLTRMSWTPTDEQVDEFCRHETDTAIEVRYDACAWLQGKTLYFVPTGPVFASDRHRPSHCWWLRKYGKKDGIVFTKAVFRPLSEGSRRLCRYDWNSEQMTMRWPSEHGGAYGVVLFFQMEGPPFIVIMTLATRSKLSRIGQPPQDISVRVCIKPVHDIDTNAPDDTWNAFLKAVLDVHREVSLPMSTESSSSFVQGHTAVSARLAHELIFDLPMFVLEVSIS